MGGQADEKRAAADRRLSLQRLEARRLQRRAAGRGARCVGPRRRPGREPTPRHRAGMEPRVLRGAARVARRQLSPLGELVRMVRGRLMSARNAGRPRGVRRQALDMALLAGLAIVGAGCGSAPIGPTYTEQELKTICERQRGWWHADDLMGGYCEYRG